MVPSSLFCPKCGGLNEAGSVTCFACGASMQAGPATPKITTTINAPLLTTKMLQERYRLLSQIGEGGFGAVYVAEDTRLGNRLVAIKEMKPSGLKPQELQEATEAFRREAMLLTGLHHPSLPTIHDQFTEDGQWYLVMEYIKGKTLESYLAKAPKNRLSVRESFQIALKICTVLDYLHSQQPPIIFRDLKPSNVMLTPEGQVYLIDFGIARHFKPGQSKDTTAFGTTGYAAPEQYGKAQTTPRSDIYSLGAVLHHMLTGDDPANTPFRFAPLLMPRPTGTWTFLRQMVEIEEYKRPPDLRVVGQTLQHLSDRWEADRRGGPATSALPAYQAATGFLPAMRPGQMTQPPPMPTRANASMQAPPQVYPVQAAPGQPAPGQQPPQKRGIQPIYIVAVVLVIFILIALIAAIASTNNQTQYQNNNNNSGSTNVYVPPNDQPPTYTPVPVSVGLAAVAWSPSGTAVAAACECGSVQLWNVTTGGEALAYTEHTGAVSALAWSPNGNLIASGGTDTTVRVWDASTAQTVYVYKGHTDRVSTIAWSPDGTRIASASDDHTVQVWDATSGQHVLTYTADPSAVWALAWSPDGKYLASGGKFGLVEVWDASTGDTLFRYGLSGGVESVAWSPDSKRVVAVGGLAVVQVWNALDGGNPLDYTQERGTVVTVAWSPKGALVASGGTDHDVQVWDAANGNLTYTFTGHKDTVLGVAWSPDGSELASGSSDGTVLVWNVYSGKTVVIFPPQA